jgi:transaldolase
MKFFIDTANIAQIKEAAELGILDGVTTNPSLMAKEGITGTDRIYQHYRDICAIVDGDVSAEVIATEYKAMIEEGKALADLAPNIVVKVPMTKDGVKAIHWLSAHNIRTNCTLVFSAGQAILAAKAGATYLSPFIGRVDDINWDGMALIRDIAEIYAIQGYDTAILAASIRNSRQIVDAAKSGADVVTCPLAAILGLLNHPLTDIGLEKFLADHRKAQEGK